jgi:hypothetical protein
MKGYPLLSPINELGERQLPVIFRILLSGWGKIAEYDGKQKRYHPNGGNMKRIRCISLISFIFLLFSLNLYAGEFLISGGAWSHTYPVTAFGENNYQVTWSDKRGGTYSYAFYGQAVDSEGNLIGGEVLQVDPWIYMSLMPEIATDGSNYLFLWSRYRDIYGPGDVYGRMLDSSGAPVGSIFRISIGNTVSANFPCGAWDGENYLVVWQEGAPTQESKIKGQFISPTGSFVGNNFLIRPTGLPAGTSQVYPGLAFDGTNYLCVWDDNRAGTRDIYGQFIAPDGNFVGTDFVISQAVDDQLLVAVAWSGTNYLAVWADYRDSSNDAGIYGQLISPDGNLIGDNFAISVTSEDCGRSWPSIASSGQSFLVAWEQELLEDWKESKMPDERAMLFRAAGIEPSRPYVWHDVYAQEISLTGELLGDVIPVCTAEYHQWDTNVSSDGENYLVVWDDSRNANEYSVIFGYIVTSQAPPSPSIQEQDNILPNLLSSVFPNPVHTNVAIEFSLPYASNVVVDVYAVTGQKVQQVFVGQKGPGTHTIYWNLLDDEGSSVPSGIYLYKISTEKESVVGKIIVLE